MKNFSHWLKWCDLSYVIFCHHLIFWLFNTILLLNWCLLLCAMPNNKKNKCIICISLCLRDHTEGVFQRASLSDSGIRNTLKSRLLLGIPYQSRCSSNSPKHWWLCCLYSKFVHVSVSLERIICQPSLLPVMQAVWQSWLCLMLW